MSPARICIGLSLRTLREAVLLVDSSKFGGASLFQIVDWSRISKVVTDREPDERVEAVF